MKCTGLCADDSNLMSLESLCYEAVNSINKLCGIAL